MEAPDLQTTLLEKEREIQHIERRKELFKRVWRIFVAVIVCGGLVVLSSVLLSIKDAAQNAEHAAKSADAANAQIKSCVTPEGQCYKRGQEAQRQAVASIGEIIYYSAICQSELELAHQP